LNDVAKTRVKKSISARLDAADRKLIAAAIEARECAHAPWSCFKVGAAALFGDEIIKGCNIEFDVYGLTNCAERTAVFAAYACGAARKRLTAIAVVADTPQPVSPCGACRQVLAELAPDADVVFRRDGELVAATVAELLPEPFAL
jgi:cytidine deaminase